MADFFPSNRWGKLELCAFASDRPGEGKEEEEEEMPISQHLRSSAAAFCQKKKKKKIEGSFLHSRGELCFLLLPLSSNTHTNAALTVNEVEEEKKRKLLGFPPCFGENRIERRKKESQGFLPLLIAPEAEKSFC